MFKKVNLSSPLGIALTVAGLVLALSPEARRTVRKWVVKGTAGVMDTMEQVGGTAAGLTQSQPVMWRSGAGELPEMALEDTAVTNPQANSMEGTDASQTPDTSADPGGTTH